MREARYDAIADVYVANFSDTDDAVLGCLLEMLEGVGGRRVLDIACGHGRVSREIARRGAAVVGVDLSKALIDSAMIAERSEPFGVRYIHGDAATVWSGASP